jgi:GNAT superfamily N-acetyltransferase
MAQLVMKHPSLTLARREGPQVRAAGPEDAVALAVLLQAAFPEMEWNAHRVRHDLLEAGDVKSTFLVAEAGRALGTASARYFTDRFPGAGYVHWVGVDPTARGRGVFDAVMEAVHGQFIADGCSTAFLETDDQRLPAITAYLRLGYVPEYTESDHELRWSNIFTTMANVRRSARNTK